MSDTAPEVRFIPGENTPMSPHLQVWKFTATMAGSISHRISGVGNALGLFVLTAWIASAAISEPAFDAVNGFLTSWLGRFIVFGFTLSVIYHLLNGLRYLLMDAGHIISKEHGNLSAWAAFLLAPVITIGIFWAAYAQTGAN